MTTGHSLLLTLAHANRFISFSAHFLTHVRSRACSLSPRCFCKDCLDILVGPGTFDKLKDVDPWSCYMCKPSQCDGNLKLRPDWRVKVQDFFVNNSAMEFVRITLYYLSAHF